MRLFLMFKGGVVCCAVSAVEPEQGSPPSEEIPPRHRPAAPHGQRYSGKPSLRQNFSNSHLCGFDLGFGSGLTNKLYRHQSKTSSSKKRPVKGLWNRCLSKFIGWRYSHSWLVFSTQLCELLTLSHSLWSYSPPPPPPV
jgi:hypothetical protein